MADPYGILGVSANASDEELRHAYRQLVQRYHPDHNGGSAEATRRFEEVQDAYSRVRGLRQEGAKRATGGSRGSQSATDPAAEERLRDLERQVREAHLARERAREAARRAAAAQRPERPSDEELGYIKTDDSFGKIVSDAREELAERLSGAREHPVAKRVADLIDELESLIPSDGTDRRQ